MNDETGTVLDAAKFLKIGRNQAYEGVRRGEIPAMRVCGRIVVFMGALKRKAAGVDAGDHQSAA